MEGIRKGNNQGLVATTVVAVGNLLHILPVGRIAVIRKIMWSNNTGFLGTIQLGTWDNTLPAALFVGLLPVITCLTGFDDELTELEIPAIEFSVNRSLVAAGRTGNIYVLGSIANIFVRLEVEEFGA